MALPQVAVIALLAPVLLIRLPPTVDHPVPAKGPDRPQRPRSIVVRMWLARLSLQIAEAALFAFLYLWFRAVDPTLGASRTAIIFGAVLAVSAPIALIVGRWADRHDRPLAPLSLTAAISAIGLVSMALAQGTAPAIAAYGLFGIASSVFLALHSAQTLRVLPRPSRRGRDLGIFNLTNTTPSLVMPALALTLVPKFGFSGLFAMLAVLALLAAGLWAGAVLAADPPLPPQVPVLPEWSSAESTVHAVFTSRHGMLPAVRAWIEHLSDAFSRWDQPV